MANGSQIEIGPARPDELDAVLHVMCDSFSMPFDAAREVYYEDPYFDPENKLALRVDGRIVSCLTIIDTQCRLGEGLARLGGIAGVATTPSERRKGYAGLLLTEAMRTMRERGYALAALFPFSYDYYRRFGWELSGVALRYMTAPRNLPSYPEAKRLRLAREEDIPDLERLYRISSEGKTMHCLRDTKRWRYLLDHIRHPLIYISETDALEGYILYEHRAGRAVDDGGTTLSPALRVLEIRASTPAACRGIVGFLADQPRVGCIEYDTTLANLEELGLLQPADGVAEHGQALASIEAMPAVMVRVLSLTRTVEALTANWAGFDGTLRMAMHDSTLGNEETIVVRGHGRGRPFVTQGASDVACVHGDAAAWSQVVTGHLGGEDGLALGTLRLEAVEGDRARAATAALFPRRTPFLPVPDHF